MGRTMGYSPADTLPPEIIAMILEHLENDPISLTATIAVNKA